MWGQDRRSPAANFELLPCGRWSRQALVLIEVAKVMMLVADLVN